MAQITLGSSLVSKASPGALYRTQREKKSMMNAIPEGKGAIGSIGRNLVEEPLNRPVATGARKVVGVRPTVPMVSDMRAQASGMGMFPGESVAPLAAPLAMGMVQNPINGVNQVSKPSSGKSGKSGKSSVSNSTSGKQSSSFQGKAPVKAAPKKASVSSLGGTNLADISKNRTPDSIGTETPYKGVSSLQEKVASSNINNRVSQLGGFTGAILRSLQNPMKAAKELAERAKKTIVNKEYKDSKGYKNKVNKNVSTNKARGFRS